MQGIEGQIRERGWAQVEFEVPESTRDEFARLGRDLIVLASEDEKFADGLSFTIDPSLQVGKNNPSFYGVSKSRNSTDSKIWIHGGYPTRAKFAERAPGLVGTREVEEYLDGLDEMLGALEPALVATLEDLSDNPEEIQELFFPDDVDLRNIHIRTVRYLDLDKAGPGDEVIESHGDMSAVSMQFFETHSGYLYGAPMPSDLVDWENSPERVEAIEELMEEMRPVEYDLSHDAAFFFGCGLKGMNHKRLEDGLDKSYPALFHAGFLPDANAAERYQGDWMAPHERITTVAFLSPRVDVMRDPELYRIPNVITCRPLAGNG